MSAGGRLLASGVAAAAALLLGGCGGSSNSSSTASTPTSTSASSSDAAAGETTATQPETTATQPSGASTTGPSGTVVASANGVRASMRPASHNPKVERPWPISFTVTRAGRAARASVAYEYLFGGQVVARRSHYTFTGHFSDVFKWPASAVGYPLTFRAVIVSGGVTLDLDYPVQVRK